MQIDENILFTWGAVAKRYNKGEVIFYEDDPATCYFQIISGSVKMYNTNEDGKEFIQGFFGIGQSFGEPPLFIDETYPAQAEALEDSVILKINKEKLLKILEEYPSIHQHFLKSMAQRIHNKAMQSRQIINQKPDHRIKAFLSSYKKQNNIPNVDKVQIPLTRQQIADVTGLRVETVIRTLSMMNKKGIVEINQHKLFY